MIMRFIVIIALAGLLAGCKNYYERRGVSALPQNRPSEWENPY